MRALVLACALATGCSAVVGFNECNTDDQCAGRFDAGAGFCTSDHLCVAEVPDERLCTEFLGAKPTDPGAVMIAGLFRLSGMAGDKDTEMADAARMAMMEIAGTNQRPLGMVLCDVALDDTAPLRSVQKAMAQYRIVGAVGPTTSGNTLAVWPEFVKNDALLVTPSATNPAISNLPDNNLVWRTCAPDDQQGDILAQFIPWNPPTEMPRVNIAYVSSPYGMGLNASFSTAWIAKSGSAPISSTPFDTGSDPNAVVMRLAQDNPDYAVLVADDDASALVQSLYQMSGLFKPTTQFLFTDGAKGPNLIGNNPVASVAARIFGTAPANPPRTVPVTQPYTNFSVFSGNYMARYGSSPATTAFVSNTYDATYVVALTVAGIPPDQAPHGAAMAALLGKMSGPGPSVNVGTNDFILGVSTLQSGGTIDFIGASGNLTWDKNGDPTDSPIEVWGIDLSTHDFCHVSPPPSDCP
jgi:branched-chain amino acid transport system substrate-binding protein